MPSERPPSIVSSSEPWDAPAWPADDEQAHPEGPSTPAAGRVRHHRQMLILSALVVALSFAMAELPGGRVALRGLAGYPLPSTCASRSVLGLKCPGCGLTRSFIHLAEGNWRASWRCHRLGGLLAAAVIFQFPYRLIALRRKGREPIPARWLAAASTGLIVLLLVNWLAEVVTGRLASL